MTDVRAVAIELDALGDTHALWSDWLASARAVLGVEPAALPADRGKAAAELDRAGAGNWRTLLERYSEDRAPVYLRRDAETSAALRALAGSGRKIGVFTDAPGPARPRHACTARSGAPYICTRDRQRRARETPRATWRRRGRNPHA